MSAGRLAGTALRLVASDGAIGSNESSSASTTPAPQRRGLDKGAALAPSSSLWAVWRERQRLVAEWELVDEVAEPARHDALLDRWQACDSRITVEPATSAADLRVRMALYRAMAGFDEALRDDPDLLTRLLAQIFADVGRLLDRR